MLFGGPEDVVVDETVVAEEGELVLHILEQTADEGGEVDDVRRLVLLEDGQRRRETAQVPVLGAQEDPRFVAVQFPKPRPERLRLDYVLDRGAQQSVSTRNEHNLLRHNAYESNQQSSRFCILRFSVSLRISPHSSRRRNSLSGIVATRDHIPRSGKVSRSLEMENPQLPSPATELVQSLLALADPSYRVLPSPTNPPSTSTTAPVATPAVLPPAKTALNKLLSYTNHIIPARPRDAQSASIDDADARDRILMSWKMSDFAYQREPCPFPTRARGLFTERIVKSGSTSQDAEEYRIIARGYDKFFNINEVSWTKVRYDYVSL